MSKLPLELSPQVARGRYASFSGGDSAAKDRMFMLGYEECQPEYLIDRADFPFWTMEYVAGGHGFYCEGEVMKPLQHGGVFCYGPNVAQHFGNEGARPFRKYFLVRRGRSFPANWERAGLVPGRLFQLGATVPVVPILDQMLDEGNCNDACTPDVVDGLEKVFLALIQRHKDSAGRDQSGARAVYDDAMEMIQRDYRRLRSLADLSQKVGYSSEYLCRIFRRFHGSSPYQVLLHRKMSAAWLLLRDGHLQVGAIAKELGYEDQLHFSRTFRKVMGCSPTSVRAR